MNLGPKRSDSIKCAYFLDRIYNLFI